MRGENPLPPVMIEAREAIALFEYARTEEMHRAKELYDAYVMAEGISGKLDVWHTMSILSLVYDTGRVQGIREERAKRKRFTTEEAQL